MRSALTMIELIFVIIILGILASVAMPKLVVTRDSAKIAVVAQQVEGGLSEILQTYASKGVIKKPHQMSQILQQLVHTGYAAETSNGVISGSIGQLTIYTQNGLGGKDHSFVFDVNQTTLVFKYSTPCVGMICKSLHKRVAEGNYSIGGSNIVF